MLPYTLMNSCTVALLSFLAVSPSILRAQTVPPAVARGATNSTEERLKALEESVRYADEHLAKAIDDLMWMRRLEEIAVIDKVRFTGPPARVTNNPTAQGAGNLVIISAY